MITRSQRQQVVPPVEVPPQRSTRGRRGRGPPQQPVPEPASEAQMREEVQEVQEALLKRIDELEVQVRNGRNPIPSHGSGAETISRRLDIAGRMVNTLEVLGYEFDERKRIQTGSCPTFDGISMSGDHWIKHLERSGRRFNWDYINQLSALIEALTGKAKSWYNALPVRFHEDLVYLKEEIKKKFFHIDTSAVEMTKVSKMKIKPGQDVEDFWYEVRAACQRANPGMDSVSMVSWFLNGLPEDFKASIVEKTKTFDDSVLEFAKMKQAVMGLKMAPVKSNLKSPVEMILEEEPWNLFQGEEGTEAVHQIENQKARDIRKEEEKKNLSQRVVTLKDLEEFKETIKEMVKRRRPFVNTREKFTPQKNFRTKDGKVSTCFICNQPGHYKKDCPKNRINIRKQRTDLTATTRKF